MTKQKSIRTIFEWIIICHHHLVLDSVSSPRRSWPAFVWSLSLPRLAILFHNTHPLSPVHFSSSHFLLAFSTFVSVFLFLYSTTAYFKFQSLHYHVFIFFPYLTTNHRTLPQNMTVPPHTTCFSHPI